MIKVEVGKTVEYNGRQGFVTSVYDRYQCCVWFFSPPSWSNKGSRYCFIDIAKLKAKPVILPLRIK